jgi:hypothetical protein
MKERREMEEDEKRKEGRWRKMREERKKGR